MPSRPLVPVLTLLLGLFLTVSVARAGEEGQGASDADARIAITAFSKAWKKKDVEARIDALHHLGEVDHPKVAARLMKTLGKVDVPRLRAAVFEALSGQQRAAEKVARKAENFLDKAVRAEQKRIRKGQLGYRVEPRTGEADVDSEEGKQILAETAARGRMICAALKCYRRMSDVEPEEIRDLALFLQDPLDDLVIEMLQALATWKTKQVYPELLLLYSMYPEEYAWESGEVVQGGGTDASAKAEWMVRFGHPDKQKRRPEVVKALRACLTTLTGVEKETPDALKVWMEAHGIRTRR